MRILDVLLISTTALAVTGNDVLVVGGAGFVGYHTTLELLSRGHSPIVLHNFDDEKHSPQWEQMQRRIDELHKKDVPLYHGDLCGMPLLEYFITSRFLSGIIYLGESFGDDIPGYIERRMQCFIALLELLRNHKDVPLVYSTTPEASLIDFKSKDAKPAPVPLFSVLKSAEQQFSEVYCSMYQVKTVGVRPFYPYGPMADSGSMVYNIAESISEGKSVPLPHNAKQIPLTYDFTAVTDIATGICNALKNMPKTCGVVYDLGSSHPQKVTTAADILKKQLKKDTTNEIQILNLTSPVADISLARKEIGYSPTADFEQGVKPFVEWFMSKKAKVPKNIMKIVNVYLDSDIKMQDIKKRGDVFYERVKNLRLKYEAESTGRRPVAKFYPNKNFIFFPGVTSGIDKRTLKGRTIEELKKECGRIDECIGFTPEGSLRVAIGLQKDWTNGSGLYVADIDICQAGHHNCRGNYTCKYEGPSQCTCGCAKGWKSTKNTICVQVEYFEGMTSDKERQWKYDDALHGRQFKGQMTDSFTEHKV
ncbi:PREDICTED: UDP-glucuronate 4-epimerase 4-like isoform X2 [Amphimedon queenslandica]|uniref:NAD-dependent epimerase/dehydratase domain-containing protein n=1 Tax=Amphimedon queenslandica TaxID=400682 RepID=A0AAN0JF39_AMPQE|nr:PREDICTED: UDP-glucuronate 4-epimerase 4-like isoform X2 [Amphimedon queenslandica]|eukprot:XP_019855579.1 PREDICTED: UDP-glucuronate 4-epimerase 4-like isoform X2 [Amphimedon queenslandica]